MQRCKAHGSDWGTPAEAAGYEGADQDEGAAESSKCGLSRMDVYLRMSDKLAASRALAAETRTWEGKVIPVDFFNIDFHSDSERDPEPASIADIQPPINRARYCELRGGANLEMISPP